MTKTISRMAKGSVALVAAFMLAQNAFAQDYPSKRITFLVGYGAGGAIIDVPVRVLADKLERRFGQPFTVEYRPGAQSQIAFEALHNAPPDGYTLGFATIGLLTLPLNVKNYTLDPIKDLTPVGLFVASSQPIVLVASAKAPFKTMAELISYAKANPGRLTVGAVGTSMEMEAAMLAHRGTYKSTTVPYKGTAQMDTDLATGDLATALSAYASEKANIDAGRAIMLAVGSSKRDPQFPNVPAISEAIPGHEITSFWFGISAPPKTPAAIVNRLNEAMNAAMREPDVAPAVGKVGLKTLGGSPAEFSAFLTREKARFTEAAGLIGLKPQ